MKGPKGKQVKVKKAKAKQVKVVDTTGVKT